MEHKKLKHILTRLPSLGQLLEKHGHLSVLEYAQKYYRPSNHETPHFQSRKSECIDIISSYISRNFSSHLAQKVSKSLSENYSVSTAEHHGPIGHPFFFQSAILRGVVNPEETIVNLCTSHVSLGNSSYPRGMIFHGDGNITSKEYLTLPFFPASKRMSPVFSLASYTQEDIQKYTFKKLTSYFREDLLTEEKYIKIVDFLNHFVLHDDILNQQTYSSQITLLNNLAWSEILPDFPPFIPLDAEKIVVDILCEHLRKNMILSELMCTLELQPKIEEYFDGISCCFDQKNKKGTYLFWYLDKNHTRHALWRDDDELKNQDGSFCMKLKKEDISYHLQQGHLIPSGLLVYTSLTCYYGITCFGGFSQGNYLPKIQKSYEKILKILHGGEVCLSQQTDILNEDMLFIFGKEGTFLSALDMYKTHQLTPENVLEYSKKIDINSSILSMVEEIDRCL